MRHRNIIQGSRADLELELLKAMFTPGGEHRVREIEVRLAPRGRGKLRLISDMTREGVSLETGVNSGHSED
jgi:hypothetical protein